jgi:hypothetical protein
MSSALSLGKGFLTGFSFCSALTVDKQKQRGNQPHVLVYVLYVHTYTRHPDVLKYAHANNLPAFVCLLRSIMTKVGSFLNLEEAKIAVQSFGFGVEIAS